MSLHKTMQHQGAPLHDRLFGLDVCRTLAILSVVIGHMLLHSMPNAGLASLGFIAIFGVDLFFCLSGFLIGRILLKESSRWVEEKEQGLTRFWYRRWMRTLPLYFFFFIVELHLYWDGASSIFSQRAYLIFAQNLAWSMPSFFSLTWSLAVEEWFYFLFPLMILFIIGMGSKPRTATMITIIIFLLVPAVFRFFLFDPRGSFDNLDPNIRHIVIFRLDSIGSGVLIAYLDRWHKPIFTKLEEFRWFFVVLALGCVIFIKYKYFGLPETNYLVTIYFSFVSLVFAGLIPFFTRIARTRFEFLNKFIKYTSLISYSMYLGHTVAFTFGIYLLKKLNIFDVFYPNPWLTYSLFFLLVYSLASLTYRFIEKPVLAMRDRQTNANTDKQDTVQTCVN